MPSANDKNLLSQLRQKLASYRAQLTLMRETAPFDETERFREDWVEPLERLVARLEKNETAKPSNTAPSSES